MRKERGIVNLLIVAIALPLLALLGAVALDFVRIPLTRNLAHTALSQMLSLTIPYLCGLGNLEGEPKAQIGGGGSLENDGGVPTCQNWETVDSFLPAAHNFCFLSEENQTFEPKFGSFDGCRPMSSLPSFIDEVQVKKIAKILAESAYGYLVDSASSWPYDVSPNDIYIEVAYARMPPSSDLGTTITSCPMPDGDLTSVATAGVDGLIDIGSSQYLLQVSPIGNPDRVCRKFISMAQKALGWKVERCSGPVTECGDLWIPSYWIVAAVNIRLDSYLGGLAWPASAGGESYYIVKDWIIFPHLNVAGAEHTIN